MKRFVLWLAVLLCASVALAADDPVKQADARARRKSEMAQRHALRVAIAMETAALRRRRIEIRREPPVFWWYWQTEPTWSLSYR